ncbi:hypothetical protein D8674_034015 [Pyrus ussuriensis x Pyrus communis]|uniref:Uncharacterized protein n=1 Tax=Pyrus ussuriensis x Pyrus communis TaxID=2448454 RepID=A0A5N5HUJ7_9ROSA|nr:hypothetical protein D8674_034015 [Pyrus ussuriensis x Pyrus communis]
MRTGETNAPFDRPTPQLPIAPKFSPCAAISFGVRASSPVSEPFSGETQLDPMNSLDTKDAQKIVKDSPTTSKNWENHSGPLNKLENQTILHDGNLAPPNTKNIVYVKRMLNQFPQNGESSSSAVLNPEKDPKRSYVPKRLLIGNDEYLGIGNGNQLLKNPKKQTRMLASERVRWSLYTAKLRLLRTRVQRNARGRYFVSKDVNVPDPRTVSGKHRAEKCNDIIVDGVS